MRERKSLSELISEVLAEMKIVGYGASTMGQYRKIFNRLEKMAWDLNKVYFDKQLADAFLADSGNRKTEGYCHSRYSFHRRCVFLLALFQDTEQIKWARIIKKAKDVPYTENFRIQLEQYSKKLNEDSLEKNTRDSYRNVACKFLQFCESKGYSELNEIQRGDIPAFMQELRSTWASESLRTGATALRSFLQSFPATIPFEIYVPQNLPRKRDIIQVLSTKEQSAFQEAVQGTDVSKRDTAICLLSLETGLRAIDILNIKLSDINWLNDSIHIVQQKTGVPLNIPLLPSFGNAIAEYILHERPLSQSNYLFLRVNAPFTPLLEHSSCWHIIAKIFKSAGLTNTNYYYGTRFLRHNAASKMLENGIPLPVISSALGHTNPDSTAIYLTTDEAKLVECALPLAILKMEEG